MNTPKQLDAITNRVETAEAVIAEPKATTKGISETLEKLIRLRNRQKHNEGMPRQAKKARTAKENDASSRCRQG